MQPASDAKYSKALKDAQRLAETAHVRRAEKVFAINVLFQISFFATNPKPWLGWGVRVDYRCDIRRART